MPARTCPKCGIPGRHLVASSENAIVDYYRCDRCGHVWIIDKQGARRDVTFAVSKDDKAAS